MSIVDFSLLLPDVMTIADECDSQLKQTLISFMGQVAEVQRSANKGTMICGPVSTARPAVVSLPTRAAASSERVFDPHGVSYMSNNKGKSH
jgi:hypothetical protein